MEFVKFHCFNHNLELVIKYSYKEDLRFTEIQKKLTKFHSFSNSDKSWRMFQIIGDFLLPPGIKWLNQHNPTGESVKNVCEGD